MANSAGAVPKPKLIRTRARTGEATNVEASRDSPAAVPASPSVQPRERRLGTPRWSRRWIMAFRPIVATTPQAAGRAMSEPACWPEKPMTFWKYAGPQDMANVKVQYPKKDASTAKSHVGLAMVRKNGTFFSLTLVAAGDKVGVAVPSISRSTAREV